MSSKAKAREFRITRRTSKKSGGFSLRIRQIGEVDEAAADRRSFDLLSEIFPRAEANAIMREFAGNF